MTCNITGTPLYPEPLPLYQRETPDDAVSIRSAAPSYVSETPTYTSQCQSASATASSASPRRTGPSVPSAGTTTIQARSGLPAPLYAPGFHARSQSASAIDPHAYNIGSWSSTTSSHASRQYLAVARRRANQAANTTAMLNSLSAVPPPSSSSLAGSAVAASSSHPLPSAPDSSASNPTSYPVNVTPGPFSPLEDPYLVGEAAASKARAQRIYREMCLRGEETARYESRAWEFMLSQMADWEERDRSWTKFREQVGQTKALGRRLGLRS